tara:strand:- start:37 stop:666 length:630 start_codon:yes stop_codon:yes gene_type:complete
MKTIESIKIDLTDENKIYNRLRYLFDTSNESDRVNGLTWYKRANEIATEQAIKYGFNVSTVCAVISALSPAVSWTQNIKDSDSLLQAVAVGETDSKLISASTYGSQVDKALNIAWTNNVALIGNGLKTCSFYLNLVGIQDKSVVTIDRHILGASVGSRSAIHKEISLTPNRYFTISKAIKRLAHNRNLLPKECQAVIWLAYRTKLGYTN